MKYNKNVLLDMYLNKNLGDDLFLKILSERYPNTQFFVQPMNNYNKEYFNNNIIFERNIITRTFNIIYKKTKLGLFSITNYIKRKCDYLITLGGSMFIEKNDSKLNDKIIRSKYKNIPYFILGSNFGPYQSNNFYNLYRNVFKRSLDICFREKYSYDLFKDLKNTRYTKDMVFSLDTCKYNISNKKKVIISIIDLSNRKGLNIYQKEYENKITEIINYFVKKAYKVVLMSFCKGEGDEFAIERIYSRIESELATKYYYNGNMDEAINEIAESEYVIATRFHAMILGFILNKKVLPLIYSSKSTNVIKDLNFDGLYYDIKNIKNLNIIEQAKYIKNPNFDLKNVKKDAESHFEILDKYIK